ncbi:VWA domain-containing protein [Verrucomicrobia bacterium]|nr:VWA domain-containing protein [Verrucomicrobiota bacterium]
MHKKLHTELVFVLDRSGSMAGMEEQAVKSFNSFLADQKSIEGSASLSLVLFDNIIEVPIKAQDIQKVDEISAKDFEPRATTALLDAIGESIDDVETRLAVANSEGSDVKVIFAIFTDGYENDSSKFSWRDISRMISNRTERGWEFLFLAANEDAIVTASELNIGSHNASSVHYNKTAMGTWGDSVSSKAKSIRLKSMGREYDKECYDADLSDIVEDDFNEAEKENL